MVLIGVVISFSGYQIRVSGDVYSNAEDSLFFSALMAPEKNISPGLNNFNPSADKPQKVFSVINGTKVNINTATIEELDKLPGIGIKTAELIIEYRSRNGKFRDIDELLNIKGIGQKKFQKLQDLVTVGDKN